MSTVSWQTLHGQLVALKSQHKTQKKANFMACGPRNGNKVVTFTAIIIKLIQFTWFHSSKASQLHSKLRQLSSEQFPKDPRFLCLQVHWTFSSKILSGSIITQFSSAIRALAFARSRSPFIGCMIVFPSNCIWLETRFPALVRSNRISKMARDFLFSWQL